MNLEKEIPARTIERMVLYKRLLADLLSKGQKTLFSHQLAALAHNTSAQVRRDLMTIGYGGSPRKGYHIEELIERISDILDSSSDHLIALVGVGNLGSAILSYFTYSHPGLKIVAAFDTDAGKVNREVFGCPCFPIDCFEEKIRQLGVTLGIITVPAAFAQETADRMVASGIKGILTFAPVPLKLPDHVCNDRIDIASALEKLAYFSERMSQFSTGKANIEHPQHP